MRKINKQLNWLFEGKESVKGFVDNIETLSVQNDDFRKVLYTAEHCQLVVMSLKPKEEIGEEVHKDNDQFFRVEEGSGKVIINGVVTELKAGFAIIIPNGAKHNVIASDEGLKLYTIYSPPHHRDGVVHKTKEAAEADKEKFDGETTEEMNG
jgi:mannose-6-phosphate isomerase-like protein (cupin superfamily)